MRVVGISHKTRYWQHVAFSDPPEGYRYVRMVDIPWHLLRIRHAFLWHTRYFFPVRKADLCHTYNCIVANHRPWVIEVESYLPRFRPMRETHPLYKWGLRRLASDDCKAILFTSEHTARMNTDHLVKAGVDPAKMSVLYRAVEQFLPGEKDPEHFTILFAGNGFYRKGGVELLKAFQRLGRKDARLVIISTLEVDWGVIPTTDDVNYTRRTIAEDPRIIHHQRLPHAEVIRLMRGAHLFVSTTFADPFNNTVLEAMGCQLPVIASDISSLPEIVQHGRNGWLLPVEGLNSDAIAEELAARCRKLMDDPMELDRLARGSLQVVRERFDLRSRNKRLGEIYDRALAGTQAVIA